LQVHVIRDRSKIAENPAPVPSGGKQVQESKSNCRNLVLSTGTACGIHAIVLGFCGTPEFNANPVFSISTTSDAVQHPSIDASNPR
jgi:hypothetical protein